MNFIEAKHKVFTKHNVKLNVQCCAYCKHSVCVSSRERYCKFLTSEVLDMDSTLTYLNVIVRDLNICDKFSLNMEI